MDHLIGGKLDKYDILSELGRGGMAVVFLARDTEMDRDVAVKILPREFTFERTFVERFQQEAKAIASLSHPHILPVFDYGQADGWTYIAMTHMPGGSLADRIRQRGSAYPLDQIAETISEIAGALDYAHSRNIIHRDFKPANVLLGDHDYVALSDFGIAKVTEATAQLTGSGIIGTPAYMAPEMSRKGGVTPLIDIYALGITLFQMITGELPFEADTPMGLLMAHANEPVPDVRQYRADVPDDVQYVINRALSKNAATRYQKASDLSADLEAALAGTLVRQDGWDDLAGDAGTVGMTRPDMRGSRQTAAPSGIRVPLKPIPLIGGLIAVAAVVFGALFATGTIPLGAPPQPTAETAIPTEPPTPTVSTPVETLSLNPSATLLFGTAQLQASGTTAYQTFTGNLQVHAGDKIRTGAQSAVALIFAEGVSLELHATTEIEIVRMSVEGSTLTVEVRQLSGAAYHFIQPPSEAITVDYILDAPEGVVKHTGTQYWSVLTRLGWCFQPLQGSILFQLGQSDDDTANDFPANADNGQSVLVRPDRSISICGTELVNLVVYTDGSGGLTVDPSLVGGGGSAPTATSESPGGSGPTATVSASTEVPPTGCGNGTCDPGEHVYNCSQDCGAPPADPYCGDGACNGGEQPGSSGCSQDCGCGTCGAGGSQSTCEQSGACSPACGFQGKCNHIRKWDLCGQECQNYYSQSCC